jgi:hypothetical protein
VIDAEPMDGQQAMRQKPSYRDFMQLQTEYIPIS